MITETALTRLQTKIDCVICEEGVGFKTYFTVISEEVLRVDILLNDTHSTQDVLRDQFYNPGWRQGI